ncbi:hypothetical protein PV11_05601 [Exophiala sideris]|uniref:Uncharacterized protein n=1 Tax=Exophiala sideris TaxID=1016849 RepID=A0A0D1YL91_9EURO|nr:hypothetical protein PV11_05601 [Exophiala sideris]
MGANTSKIDDDIIALDECNNQGPAMPTAATTLRPHYERLPPVESRETIRSQARQLRHWRLLDGSDDLYESLLLPADQACDGSFAAVQSPQSHDVLQPCTPQIGQTAALATPTVNAAAPLVRPDITVNNIAKTTLTSVGPTVPTACIPAKRASSPMPDDRKKRRLMITPKAVEIAGLAVPQGNAGSALTEAIEDEQNILDCKFDWSEALNQNDITTTGLPPLESNALSEKLDQKGFPLYQDEDFNFAESIDDEGYQSITTGLSDGSEYPADEQEAQLVRMLAAFQGDNISISQPTTAASVSTNSTVEIGEQDDTLEEARQWMLRDQEAGVERSRLLREKAIRQNLQRGQILGSATTSTTVVLEDDGSDMDIVDDEVKEGQGESGPDEGMLPFAESGQNNRDVEDINTGHEPNTEELLDVVQQHVSQITSSTQYISEDTSKSHRPRKDPSALNHASRAAAEQFRTQSRHLGHITQKPAQASEDTLQERERRLRELTKTNPGTKSSLGHSVSSPNLSNQFTEDDIGRPRQVESNEFSTRHSRAQSRNDAHSGPILADSRSHNLAKRDPQRPHLSGLDMLAMKRGTALKPDRHYPSDTESHEAHKHEHFNSQASGKEPSQVFSELDLGHTRRSDTINSADTDSMTTETLPESAWLCNHNEAEQNNPSHQRLSGLDMLASRRGPVSPASTREHQHTPRAKAPTTKPPGAIAGLTLPPNFEKFSEDEQKVILEHEIAKARKRDLEQIDRTTHSIGLLRCLGTFTETESNELDEVRKYIAQVVERGECGKVRRKRISDIQGNMRRRAQGFQEPSSEEIDKWLLRMFNINKLNFVKEELARVDEKVAELGDVRRNMHTKRHSKADKRYKKKNVRFSEPMEDHGASRVQTPRPERRERPRYNGENATENRRLAQYAHQDRLREQLQAKLRLYDQASQPAEVIELPEQSDDTPESSRAHRSDGDESEEDDGAEFVYGPGRNASTSPLPNTAAISDIHNPRAVQDLKEINRLEDARQKESGTHATQRLNAAPASQRFDLELLENMKRKKVLGELGPSTSDQILNAGAVEDDSEIDSSDDSDSEDEDEEEEDRQVFKYTIMATFAGIDIYKTADEYIMKSTYKLDSAMKHVSAIIQSVFKQFPPKGGERDGDFKLDATYEDGLMRQHLMTGKDYDVEARVWIEKEIVDLDKKAFRCAKRKKVITDRALYTVVWEKIITPVLEEAEAAADDADSLFGDESLRQTTNEPVVTTIPNNEIAYFTSSILANRYAKDIYMAWHYQFLPGVQNEGYRRLEDEAMEEDLERLGSFGLFSREESFQLVEHGRRVEEKFKVCVRTIEVMGPTN